MTPRQQSLSSDRLTFLLSLVPYLLERGRVSVSEVANHFDVPAARVRTTVRTIGQSGIPGETRTYLPQDLFDIDWDALEEHDEIEITHRVVLNDAPRFSAREASALLAGLQYIRSLPANIDDALVASVSSKLAHGSTDDLAATLSLNPASTEESLPAARRAVAAQRRVSFSYRAETGERTQRRVDPWQLDSVDEDWYLRGWDVQRDDVRTFRLDRVSELTVTDEPVTHPQGDHHLSERLFSGSDEHSVVTLSVAVDALDLVSDYFDDDVEPVVEGEWATVDIRVAHYASLRPLVGAHPGLVSVVAPERARRSVEQWASRALENYADSASAVDSDRHQG